MLNEGTSEKNVNIKHANYVNFTNIIVLFSKMLHHPVQISSSFRGSILRTTYEGKGSN
jgi:hypothetical protein